jgi:succinate dehydrogenase / fumarate reductase, flavoprotein subunit
MDLKTMEVKTFAADATIFCTGGNGAIYYRSTNSVVCTGMAQSALFQQGVDYANGEFIQVHPTAIPGEDKLRLMSESARGEGGRVWVPKTVTDTREPNSIPANERFYFLEEWYPKYGNLVPRDVATRAIHKVVFELKLGLGGQQAVYLDVTTRWAEFGSTRKIRPRTSQAFMPPANANINIMAQIGWARIRSSPAFTAE